jgi:hypothetical protein
MEIISGGPVIRIRDIMNPLSILLSGLTSMIPEYYLIHRDLYHINSDFLSKADSGAAFRSQRRVLP